jgi:hypothetical protein
MGTRKWGKFTGILTGLVMLGMALGGVLVPGAGLSPAYAAGYDEVKLTTGDAAAGDLFGHSVAISGDTAVIGAYYDDDAGENSGSTYVFVRSGTAWSQQAKLTAGDAATGDWFGFSVAISGDTTVIGAIGDDDGGTESGSAYVFVRSGTSWSQQAKLTASDAAAGDYFGFSVAINGDTAVIGAAYADDGGINSGSAYVFVRSGTTWSQQQKLKAGDAAAGGHFGYSTAISGDTAVIGAYGDNESGLDSGSAYVFVRSGTSWSQQQKLKAGDAAAYDEFGKSVAISGDTAVIGAYLDDDNDKIASGSVYVFVRSGTAWSQQAKLTAGDANIGDEFGWSVATSGDMAVISAVGDDDGGEASGSAYVFVRSGAAWSQQAKLTASDAARDDQFGISVAISGDTAAIGAFADDDGSSDINYNSGSAYVYTLLQGSGTVTCTVMPRLLSITVADGSVVYGDVDLGATKSTLGLQPVDTQTITNTGNMDEKIEVKCSDAINGIIWQLVASSDTERPDEFAHQWSGNGGGIWSDFDPGHGYGTLNPSLAPAGTQPLDLKIYMPTSTSDTLQKSITVTVLATTP